MRHWIPRLRPAFAVALSLLVGTFGYLTVKVFADAATTQPSPAQAWSDLQNLTQYVAATTQPAQPERGWECMNGASNVYYSICRWANVAKSASGFWQVSGSAPFQYSPHGYPVGHNIQAMSQLWMYGCKAGDYKVECKGKVAFTIAAGGGSKYVPIDANHGTLTLPAEGTIAATPWGPGPTQQVMITVTDSDPADPLDQFHIWAPGYGPGTGKDGQVYDDRYLALLKNFAGYRAMNDMGTVCPGGPATTWDKRVTPDMWDQTSFGISSDDVIALAVEAGFKRIWICVPFGMNSADAAKMAEFYHDNLPAGIQLIVEPGNELWNWGFAFRTKLYQQEQANPAAYNGYGTIQVGDPNWLDARAAVEWARAVVLPFKAAFADRPLDLQCVFAGQAAWNLWIDAGLGWCVAKYGSHPFDAIAIAPYYGYGVNLPTLDATYAKLTPWMSDNTQANTGLEWEIDQHLILAEKYHCRDGVEDYEGDGHLPANVLADGHNTLDPNGVNTLFQTDPRTGNLQDLYFAVLHHKKIRLHCSFSFLEGNWDQWGYWPILRSYEDQTPRWDACQRECLRSN